MNAPVEWYRSDPAVLPPAVRPSASRRVRSWLRDRLPDPDVRDKTMVLYARQGFRRLSAWAGMFSEFHSVLGALAYAETHGAAGVRVDFRSDLYVDPDRGPNWWTYFFTRADMPVRPGPAAGELHLNGVIAKYGRHGGFCDLVNGATPYLYPMTFGVDRQTLHRLLTTYVEVLPELRDEVGGMTRMRGLAAFAAEWDGREIRAIGLDHERARGQACGGFLHDGGVLESDDPGE